MFKGDPTKSVPPIILTKMLDMAYAPVVIDVCRAPIFAGAEDMIDHASWRDPAHVRDWIGELPADQDYVVYCVHGHEVSQFTAAALRANGIRATYLDGCINGYRAIGGRVKGRAIHAN